MIEFQCANEGRFTDTNNQNCPIIQFAYYFDENIQRQSEATIRLLKTLDICPFHEENVHEIVSEEFNSIARKFLQIGKGNEIKEIKAHFNNCKFCSSLEINVFKNITLENCKNDSKLSISADQVSIRNHHGDLIIGKADKLDINSVKGDKFELHLKKIESAQIKSLDIKKSILITASSFFSQTGDEGAIFAGISCQEFYLDFAHSKFMLSNLDNNSAQNIITLKDGKNKQEICLSNINAKEWKFYDLDFPRNIRVHFQHNNLLGATSIEDAQKLGMLDMTGVKFNQAPNFIGTELPQRIFFPGLGNFCKIDKDAVHEYRYLRHALANTGHEDQSRIFFALEQRCLRKRHGWRSGQGWVSRTADWVSVYGLSVWRPIGWLAATLFGFAAVYYWQLPFEKSLGGMKDALYFSSQQILRPFELNSLRTTAEVIATNMLGDAGLESQIPVVGIKILAAVQSILSIIFIAAFLLAARQSLKSKSHT